MFFILPQSEKNGFAVCSTILCARAREYGLGLNSLVRSSSECKFLRWTLVIWLRSFCGGTTTTTTTTTKATTTMAMATNDERRRRLYRKEKQSTLVCARANQRLVCTYFHCAWAKKNDDEEEKKTFIWIQCGIVCSERVCVCAIDCVYLIRACVVRIVRHAIFTFIFCYTNYV